MYRQAAQISMYSHSLTNIFNSYLFKLLPPQLILKVPLYAIPSSDRKQLLSGFGRLPFQIDRD